MTTKEIELIGAAAATSSVVLAGFGLPVQMYKAYKARSTEGISLLMIIILWVVYVLWTFYGVVLKNHFIWGPNGLGLICSSLFLAQWFLQWFYRTRR